MVLLASAPTIKSNYFRADDLDGDLKLRVKNVTEEIVGEGADKAAEACRLVHQRQARLRAQPAQQSHPARCVRRRHGRLGRQDHHHLLR